MRDQEAAVMDQRCGGGVRRQQGWTRNVEEKLEGDFFLFSPPPFETISVLEVNT